MQAAAGTPNTQRHATSRAVSEGRFQHADIVCTNDCVPRTGTPSAGCPTINGADPTSSRTAIYLTTTFTSLPGTTITFTTVLPSNLAATFASASAAALIVASSLPAGT